MRARPFFSMPAALMIVLVISCAFLATPLVRAQTFTVLYSFGGGPDGRYPYGGLVRDAAGNLYGTTSQGGVVGFGNSGYGTVFQLASPGKKTTLYSFTGGADGSSPCAGLIFDGSGNLYGTTSGTVFELMPSSGVWTENVLHVFTGEPDDGAYSCAVLIMDAAGNLYGTTLYGGADNQGTVFSLTASAGGWTEDLLYSFQTSEGYPQAVLVMDTAGDLYGTTSFGGSINGGQSQRGTVFELTASAGGWTENLPHSFRGGTDGIRPEAGLIQDGAGNFYGTTSEGGGSGNNGNGYGTVFKVDAAGKETVLYSFQGGTDGSHPWAGLVIDSAGNLYGTTSEGGGSGNRGRGYGTVFMLDKTGKETLLYSFTGGADGRFPGYGTLLRAGGNLYGTTLYGGDFRCNERGCGVIFKLTP